MLFLLKASFVSARGKASSQSEGFSDALEPSASRA